MMKQDVMRALGHFALVIDVDALGYLGGEDLTAAQRARVESASAQQRLALEYLHKSKDRQLAKQQLRRDITDIEADTVDRKFSDDETSLFERFAAEIDMEIDRLSQKPEWQQTVLRLFLKVPTQIVVLAFIASVVAAVILIAKILRA